MRRLTTLAAALLIAAPLIAAEAPKTANPQTQTQTTAAAPQDSPLVAAAKRAVKSRTGKTTVITNETLVKTSSAGITTTDTQPAITLPSPDAALIAMQNGSKPQAKSGQPAGRLSPAEEERQRRAAQRAARAEDAGPYSDNPHGDEVTIAAAQNPTVATTQNPTSTTTQNPGYSQTQNPSSGQAQNPDQMQQKKP